VSVTWIAKVIAETARERLAVSNAALIGAVSEARRGMGGGATAEPSCGRSNRGSGDGPCGKPLQERSPRRLSRHSFGKYTL